MWAKSHRNWRSQKARSRVGSSAHGQCFNETSLQFLAKSLQKETSIGTSGNRGAFSSIQNGPLLFGKVDNKISKLAYNGFKMNREITSKFWIWFIRAWLSIPLALWIPHLLAFFYSDRPSEAHLAFWLIVLGLEAIYCFMLFKVHDKRKLIVPEVRSFWLPLIYLIIFVPRLRYSIHLTAQDNFENRRDSILMILTVLPIIFLSPVSTKKTSAPPSPLSDDSGNPVS